MEQRVLNIMRFLATEFEIAYEEAGTNIYELNIGLSNFNHKTFIKFVITSDIIRTELKHLFGTLNGGSDTTDLLSILIENSKTFQNTSAYLGVKIIDDAAKVSLNTYHHFLSKWEDRDIAEIISIQVLDIKVGLIAWSFPENILARDGL